MLSRQLARIVYRADRLGSVAHALLLATGTCVSGDTTIPTLEPSKRFLGLWFNCWDSFARLEGEIREGFSPTEELTECLPSMGGEWVALHVRRGDYKQWRNGTHYYEWPQYETIARQLLDRHPNTKLMVSSNELIPNDWLPGVEFAQASSDALVAMYTLARCRAICGPPSTFSLWAAWCGHSELHQVRGGHMEPPIYCDTAVLRSFEA